VTVDGRVCRDVLRSVVPGRTRVALDGIEVAPAPGLAPVGRLDLDSAGLLLLTNDHALAAALLDPATHVEKVYRVKVKGVPSEATLSRLTSERVVDGLAPIDVRLVSENPGSAWLRVALSEGKNRQIRRQLAAVGHDVEVLIRVAFGPIALGTLAPGGIRPLEPDEVRALRAAVRLPG
jgi:23S rRNA pseudouridine2605 synthase